MTTKQMIFATMIFISMNNFTFSMWFETSEKKDFVFDRGMYTKVNDNSIFSYIYLKREQGNPSYVFKHTRVIECTKDKELTEIGTLGSLEKAHRLSGRYPSVPDAPSLEPLNRFEKFARMNNAICCADVEQKLNYFDKPEDIGAIVYGTQDVKDCALVKEYLKQQKLAEEK